MHREFDKTVEYLKLEKKLKHLSKKTFDESSTREAENRIQYAWRVGKVDQLKKDIPLFLKSKAFKEVENSKSDWRSIIHLWEHVPSEWARFVDIIDELYIYFKKTGNIEAEQKMLGAKIQGAHLMENFLNEKKYLLQIIKEVGPDDERYETYYPLLGWWYQDHGQWDKSIIIFEEQYKQTKSTNMLASLIWGHFNNNQFKEVLKYEDEILKLPEFKVNYILAKSYQKLGKEQQAKYYYEKFNKQNYKGSDVVFYYTDREDSKFYHYDESYLKEVADYFSISDSSYSCALNKHIYEMIQGSLNSDYAVSLERKVILAQELPELQQFHNNRYQSKRNALLDELRVLKEKFYKCENPKLISTKNLEYKRLGKNKSKINNKIKMNSEQKN